MRRQGVCTRGRARRAPRGTGTCSSRVFCSFKVQRMQGAVGEAGDRGQEGQVQGQDRASIPAAQPTEEFAELAVTSWECGPALGGRRVTAGLWCCQALAATPPTTVPELSVTRVLPRQPPWHSYSVTSVKTASPWRARARVPGAPVSGLSPRRRIALELGLSFWNNLGSCGSQGAAFRSWSLEGLLGGCLVPGHGCRGSHVVRQTRTCVELQMWARGVCVCALGCWVAASVVPVNFL